MIRYEFEKAFQEQYNSEAGALRHSALWAAQWMAERLAVYAEMSGENIIDNDEIRQLAKELL